MDAFGEYDLDAIKEGYTYSDHNQTYTCLICGSVFEKGLIYTFDGQMYEAFRAVKEHLNREHGGMLSHLLQMDKKYTGLTDKQNQLMVDISKGLSDREISKKNGLATSTVRHQRFMLREKAKQAKIYLAIYDGVENQAKFRKSDSLMVEHPGAKMVDERYWLSEEEYDKILSHYFEKGDSLKLKTFPSKEKKKIAVLRKITESFDENIRYSETQMNEILKVIYDDIATIRRYLIQYGFFDRTKDGQAYWIKKA